MIRTHQPTEMQSPTTAPHTRLATLLSILKQFPGRVDRGTHHHRYRGAQKEGKIPHWGHIQLSAQQECQHRVTITKYRQVSLAKSLVLPRDTCRNHLSGSQTKWDNTTPNKHMTRNHWYIAQARLHHMHRNDSYTPTNRDAEPNDGATHAPSHPSLHLKAVPRPCGQGDSPSQI